MPRTRRLLLVLDNYEHLVSACATLTSVLLRGCAGLGILATSRTALGVEGEVVWVVPTLSVPPQTETSADTLARYEVVELFVARAKAAHPGFALRERDATALVRICRRLDGIPLAVELAAARIRALPVEVIAARLDDRFQLLTGGPRTVLPRQQTLHARH